MPIACNQFGVVLPGAGFGGIGAGLSVIGGEAALADGNVLFAQFSSGAGAEAYRDAAAEIQKISGQRPQIRAGIFAADTPAETMKESAASALTNGGFEVFNASPDSKRPAIRTDTPVQTIRDVLAALNITPLDPAKNPVIAEALKEIAALTERLTLPEDGDAPIHIVIADDMFVNARFIKTNTGEKVLVLNLGELNFCESDDELACTIGHELSHGPSEIDEYLKHAEISGLEKMAMRRAGETEADIKSCLRRVHEAGMNPHAELHRRGRLIERLGNSGGWSHPFDSSREDAVAIAITVFERGLGKEIKPDIESAYERRIVDAVHMGLTRTEAFRMGQIERAEAVAKRPEFPVRAFLTLIKDGVSKIQEIFDTSRFYDDAHRNLSDKIRSYALGLVSEEELIDMELYLHASLYRLFEKAVAEVMGGGTDIFANERLNRSPSYRFFQNAIATVTGSGLTNLTKEQCEALFDFYSRRKYRTSVSHPDFPDCDWLVDLKNETAGLREKMAEKSSDLAGLADQGGDGAKEIRSEIENLDASLKRRQRIYDLILSQFDPSVGSDIEKAMEMRARVRSSLSDPSGPAAYREAEQALKAHIKKNIRPKQRVLAPILEETGRITERLRALLFEAALKDPATMSKLQTFISDAARLAPHLIKADPVRILKAINRAAEKEFRHAGSRAFERVMEIWGCDYSLLDIFTDAYERYPADAIICLREYVDMLISHAADAGQMKQILHTINEHVDPRGQWDDMKEPPFSISSGGMSYTPEIAKKIFTPEVAGRYIAGMAMSCERLGNSVRARVRAGGGAGPYEKRLALDESVSALNKIAAATGTLRLGGLIPIDSKTIRTHTNSAVQSVASALADICRTPSGKRLTRTQAISILISQLPDVREMLLAPGEFDNDTVRRELASVAEDDELGLSCANAVDYFQLHNFFEDTDTRAAREDFFRFARRIRRIVNFAPFCHDWQANDRSRPLFAGAPRYSKPIRGFDIRRTAIEFSGWIRDNHPEDIAIRYALLHPYLGWSNLDMRLHMDHNDDGFTRHSIALMQERLKFWLDAYAHLPRREQMEEAAFSAWRENPLGAPEYFIDGGSGYEIPQPFDFPPAGLMRNIEFLNASIRALQRIDIARDEESERERMRKWFVRKRIGMERLAELAMKHEIKNDSDIALLIEAHGFVVKYKETSRESDDLFEKIWNATEGHAHLRRALTSPEMAGRLFYDENKKSLAIWQIEERFGLAGLAKDIRKGRLRIPSKSQIRDVVRQVRDFIDMQFEEPSTLKNEVIEHAEDALVTNPAETRFMDERRLTTKEWYKDRRLAAIDAPHAITRYINNHFDRLLFVRYLLGIGDRLPVVYVGSEGVDVIKNNAPAARRFFTEASIHLRMYALQPLLDERQGIMSNPELSEDIYDIILGENAKDSRFKKIMLAYLDALGNGKKKVVIGYILASIAASANKKPSLRQILEAMGPLGIKAGQFLRASGMVNEKLRAELDDFFDNALKPARGEMFDRIETFLGRGFPGLVTLGELAGSGSINYVAFADMEPTGWTSLVPFDEVIKAGGMAALDVFGGMGINPADTGGAEEALAGLDDLETLKPVSVAVRATREHAEGKIAVENRVWQKAIETLSGDDDPEVRRIARTLNEVREHAMETLKKGGAELNQDHEVSLYPSAREAYERDAGGENMFRIRAVRPINDYRALYQSHVEEFSIYEALDSHVPISEIKDPKMQRQAAREIVRAEFDALFKKGRFDPDGQPGNWMVDVEKMELVRIDYAQLRQPRDEEFVLPGREIDAFKKVLAYMIMPVMGEDAMISMDALLPDLFETSEPVAGAARALGEIMADRDFPGFMSPHDRIFFMRQRIEEYYRARGQPDIRIRLNDTPRSALTSISRTRIYAEYIGDDEYMALLAEAM